MKFEPYGRKVFLITKLHKLNSSTELKTIDNTTEISNVPDKLTKEFANIFFLQIFKSIPLGLSYHINNEVT